MSDLNKIALNGTEYTVVDTELDGLSSDIDEIKQDLNQLSLRDNIIIQSGLETRQVLADGIQKLKYDDALIEGRIDTLSSAFSLYDFFIKDAYGNIVCDYYGNKIIAPTLCANADITAEEIKNEIAFDYASYGLPVVYLDGNMDGISKENKVNLHYMLGNYNGTCQLKWQGSSSLAYPKKNYTITLDKPRTVVQGWGEHDKYVFKANWIDFSHIRNILSASLWGQCVRYATRDSVYITNPTNGNRVADYNGNKIKVYNDPLLTAPNYGAIAGFPIFLVINGKYQGLYSMNIPKDGWMMFMEGNENGAIISAEGGDYVATQFKGLSDPIEDETDFSLEYATNEDDISWITDSLNTAIQAVMDNMNNPNFYEVVNPYLDIQSALDYMIFSALTCNVDGVGRNYLLSTFDGVQWRFTAYDLDSTFGNEPYGKFYYDPETRATMVSTKYANNAFGIIYDNAKQMLVDRYEQLREGVLSEHYVSTIAYNYLAQIPDIAFIEDQKIWKGIPSTRTNNIEQMMNWYRMHVQMLDAEMNTLKTSLSS